MTRSSSVDLTSFLSFNFVVCTYMLGPGKFSCSCEGTFVLDQRIGEGGEGGVGCEYICMCVYTYLRICMCESEVQYPRSRRDG